MGAKKTPEAAGRGGALAIWFGLIALGLAVAFFHGG